MVCWPDLPCGTDNNRKIGFNRCEDIYFSDDILIGLSRCNVRALHVPSTMQYLPAGVIQNALTCVHRNRINLARVLLPYVKNQIAIILRFISQSIRKLHCPPRVGAERGWSGSKQNSGMHRKKGSFLRMRRSVRSMKSRSERCHVLMEWIISAMIEIHLKLYSNKLLYRKTGW